MAITLCHNEENQKKEKEKKKCKQSDIVLTKVFALYISRIFFQGLSKELSGVKSELERIL